MLDVFLVVAVVFLSTVWVVEWWSRPKNLPPGPLGLPVIGSLLFLGRKPHITLNSWAKKYGDLFFCRLGVTNTLVLNSCEAIKEGFIRHGATFSGRPNFYGFTEAVDTTKYKWGADWKAGVVLNDGPSWYHQRRFTMSCLRDFGVGKSSLEGKVKEEVEVMLDELSRVGANGQCAVDIGEFLEVSITNVICSIVFGERYEYNDEKFRELIHLMQQSIRIFSKSGPLNFLPFLAHFPPFRQIVRENLEIRDKLISAFEQRVLEHKATLDKDHVRDFIDAYLIEMGKENGGGDGEEAIINERQLIANVGDLFGAGSDTTNTTLKWAFLYLAQNPEVQAKVHEELDQVVGRSRLPTLQDRPHLTYVEACCNEIQRKANIVPFGVMHRVTENTTIRGYTIPVDTMIVANLWAVHNDEKHWPSPDKFQPERFINDQGKVVKPDSFMPFSIGKRVCLGEALAKLELYLFFTSLLHRFSFSFPKGHEKPSMEGTLGIVLAPDPYKIVATPR